MPKPRSIGRSRARSSPFRPTSTTRNASATKRRARRPDSPSSASSMSRRPPRSPMASTSWRRNRKSRSTTSAAARSTSRSSSWTMAFFKCSRRAATRISAATTWTRRLIADCALPIADWQKRELVIEAKHRLSTEEAVRIDVPFVEGKNLRYELTRDALEKIARPIIQRTRTHCLRALSDAKLNAAAARRGDPGRRA